jgi:hypothetical protein
VGKGNKFGISWIKHGKLKKSGQKGISLKKCRKSWENFEKLGKNWEKLISLGKGGQKVKNRENLKKVS